MILGRALTPSLLPFLCLPVFAQSADWAMRIGGEGGNGGAVIGGEIARAVEIDSVGNVYVIGTCYDGARVGNSKVSLELFGGMDIVVAKIDREGKIGWITTLGSERDDGGYDIAVGQGHVIITGAAGANMASGPHTVTRGYFIARLSARDGSVFSMNAITALPNEHEIDERGNVVAGCREGLYFFDSQNVAQWTVPLRADNPHQTGIRGVAFASDGSGDILCGGQFSRTMQLGDTMLTARSGIDGFLGRYDNNGNRLWLGVVEGVADETVRGVAVCSGESDDLWFSGAFVDSAMILGRHALYTNGMKDVFVFRCNAQGDLITWARAIGGPSWDEGAEIAVNAQGAASVAGSFRNRISFGARDHFSAGEADFLIARLTPAGEEDWMLTASGGPRSDMAYACDVNTNNVVAYCGYFQQTAQFGETVLSSHGLEDIVIGICQDITAVKRDTGPAVPSHRASASSDSYIINGRKAPVVSNGSRIMNGVILIPGGSCTVRF